MTRTIDADALTNKYGDWYTEEGTEEGFIGCLKQLIDGQPTVDAVPTEWIDKYTYENPLTCYEGFHSYIRNMICEWRKENEQIQVQTGQANLYNQRV